MNLEVSNIPWIWIAAFSTLGIYTILYRENPIFRLLEHIFIGLAASYGLVVVIHATLVPKWWTPMSQSGVWLWMFPAMFGLMFYFIYSRRFAWVARLVMVGLLGYYAGLELKRFTTFYIPQVAASFKPIVGPDQAWFFHFNNLLFVLTLLTVMSYFFFSVEHKGLLAGSARLGRWLLMAAFGAIFGNTIMGRLSLFIDRVAFLLYDWLGITPISLGDGGAG